LIVRSICDHYKCLPSDVENLTLDQITLLIVDTDDLAKLAGRRRASAGRLQSEGLMPRVPGGSLVQRIRAEKQRAKQGDRRARRERRAQRRADMIARLEAGEL